MLKKKLKVLFYTVGAVPTKAERNAASKIKGGDVRFRNASLIQRGDRPESCDALAGAVPLWFRELGIPIVGERSEKESAPNTPNAPTVNDPTKGQGATAPKDNAAT